MGCPMILRSKGSEDGEDSIISKKVFESIKIFASVMARVMCQHFNINFVWSHTGHTYLFTFNGSNRASESLSHRFSKLQGTAGYFISTLKCPQHLPSSTNSRPKKDCRACGGCERTLQCTFQWWVLLYNSHLRQYKVLTCLKLWPLKRSRLSWPSVRGELTACNPKRWATILQTLATTTQTSRHLTISLVAHTHSKSVTQVGSSGRWQGRSWMRCTLSMFLPLQFVMKLILDARLSVSRRLRRDYWTHRDRAWL